jgi:hypothetical protein
MIYLPFINPPSFGLQKTNNFDLSKRTRNAIFPEHPSQVDVRRERATAPSVRTATVLNPDGSRRGINWLDRVVAGIRLDTSRASRAAKRLWQSTWERCGSDRR